MGQTVESEATDPETLPPVSRYRVGERGQRHPGVKRGVEAGDLHDVGCGRPHLGERGQRRWLVQWRERCQPPQILDHLVGDNDRIGEGRPAVHDPMPDRLKGSQPGQATDSRPDLARVRAALPRV